MRRGRPIPAPGSGFSLQFDGGEIGGLARRYGYATDHRATRAGRQAQERGYYTKPEFMAVCRWKSLRSAGRAEANPPAVIRRQTTIALRAEDEATRLRALTELQGVGVPVASTLLHFAFPRRYPMLDWRALESLGQKPRSTYPIAFWLGYVDACQRIARENHVHVRTLDKALWQHSRETSG
jgi:hypothetical protein